MIERIFKLKENRTCVRTELIAGITTFLTMAYIIFVNPAILSVNFNGTPTGLDFNAVMLATCLSAAIATFIMGAYANYPIAQAPGMGENFFFVSVIGAISALGVANAWQVALGIVFIAGLLFLIISLFNVRETLIKVISPSLKNGIAVGIGIFIAFLGLQNANILISNPGTLVQLNNNIINVETGIFAFGLVVISILLIRKIKGAIFIGIILSAVLSLVLGKIKFTGIVSIPPSIVPTFFKMDIIGVFKLIPIHEALSFIIILLFMDIFDTTGTIVGVGEQAGFIKDNKLPRANKALVSDAIGTITGACLGTSTVTSYIESASGVQAGGRTGLTAVFVSFFFVLAIFFSPLVKMIGMFKPITAPALVIVGAMMMKNVVKIDWDDYTESIPAFLTIVGIPLTCSISNGLAFGFIAYPICKIFSGKVKDASWLVYLLGVIFFLRYLLL
ncbi:MAG: NCS2 family permease [Candidatus Orphnella occulta]|nr:NCS2 family permease [Candidatus Orphnella occulta]